MHSYSGPEESRTKHTLEAGEEIILSAKDCFCHAKMGEMGEIQLISKIFKEIELLV